VDRVFDASIDGESLERHQHVRDLFPAERFAVDDDHRQGAVRVRVSFDASDQTAVGRQLPAEFRLLDMAPRHVATHVVVQLISSASISRPVAKSIDLTWKVCGMPSASASTMAEAACCRSRLRSDPPFLN
jgi:hypothetical protein